MTTYELRTVRLSADGADVERCGPDDPQMFWSIYKSNGQGYEWVGDIAEEKTAKSIFNTLNARGTSGADEKNN